jgi:hypothetical protein
LASIGISSFIWKIDQKRVQMEVMATFSVDGRSVLLDARCSAMTDSAAEWRIDECGFMKSMYTQE